MFRDRKELSQPSKSSPLTKSRDTIKTLQHKHSVYNKVFQFIHQSQLIKYAIFCQYCEEVRAIYKHDLSPMISCLVWRIFFKIRQKG